MPNPLTLARLPIELSFRVTGLAFGVARRVVGAVVPDEEGDLTERVRPARVTISSRERRPAAKPRRRPATPRRRPAAPPEPPEPAHVSEEPTPVASFAEPGAEDGPGPEIQLLEPWDGYDGMRAGDIERKLRAADAEVAAAVKLYEGAGRGRTTVLAAADRRLQA